MAVGSSLVSVPDPSASTGMTEVASASDARAARVARVRRGVTTREDLVWFIVFIMEICFCNFLFISFLFHGAPASNVAREFRLFRQTGSLHAPRNRRVAAHYGHERRAKASASESENEIVFIE
jgi:hypothetical protein